MDYIGADYPLFYEDNHGISITSLLREGALTRAEALLQVKHKSCSTSVSRLQRAAASPSTASCCCWPVYRRHGSMDVLRRDDLHLLVSQNASAAFDALQLLRRARLHRQPGDPRLGQQRRPQQPRWQHLLALHTEEQQPVVHSSTNYSCTIRMAIAPLMRVKS
jgi:hypothetical protein